MTPTIRQIPSVTWSSIRFFVYILFFPKEQFSFYKRCLIGSAIYHLDFETLDIPGVPYRTGYAFLCLSFTFSFSSWSDFQSIMVTNDKWYRYHLSFYPIPTPLKALEPILSKEWNNFIVLRLLLGLKLASPWGLLDLKL